MDPRMLKKLGNCSRVKETKKTKIQCVILDSSSKDKVIKDISGTAGKMWNMNCVSGDSVNILTCDVMVVIEENIYS